MIMRNKNNENGSQSFGEIGENCIFLFKEAFGICKNFFSVYIALMAIVDAIDSIIVIVLYKYLLDCSRNGNSFQEIVFSLILFGGVGGLFTISIRAFLNRYYEVKILEVTKQVNLKLFAKAVQMDILNYDNEEYYDHFIRAMQNSDTQMNAIIKTCAGLISMMLSILGISGVVLYVDPAMFLFPFLACFIHFFSNLQMTKIRYKLNQELTPLTRKKDYCRRVFYQPEYAKEMRLTDIFGAHITLYKDAVSEEIKCERKYAAKLRIVKMINSIVGWVALVYYLPLQYLIYNSVVTSRLGLGDVSAMNESNQSLINNIDVLGNNMANLQEISLFGNYYKSFLECEKNIETRTGVFLENEIPKKIELKNVSFSYDGILEHSVLKNINMTIEPGQKIAIVGYNGSGKSSFIKLLLNLYTVTEGSIFYDGKKIEEFDCGSYRNQFGILFQDFQTYALSIKDNVLMGDNNDTDLKSAMSFAHIAEKVETLEEQENSVLTQEFNEKGILLSGGESQRLALARLYLRQKPVILLDEHTSALDPITEKKVNDDIFTKFKEHTIIYISHHLTSVCNADYIYFMENGEIVESGTHEELMKMNNRYKLMFDKQTSYYTA